MKKGLVIDLVSCLLILLFLYTGLFKLLDLHRFQAAIGGNRLIHPFAGFLAPAVVLTELSIAGMLLLPFFIDRPRLRRWGLTASAVLMGLFTGYVFYMIYFGNGLPCTCGGIIQQMNWHQHLYFNTAFTLMALIALRLQIRQLKEKPQERQISGYPVNYKI